jgi:hypothetical protein
VKEETRASRTFCASVPESPVIWSDINLSPDDVPALYKIDGKYLDWVKSCQSETFEEEIRCIRKKKQLQSTSNILAQAPILDSDWVLRLSGRVWHFVVVGNVFHFPHFTIALLSSLSTKFRLLLKRDRRIDSIRLSSPLYFSDIRVSVMFYCVNLHHPMFDSLYRLLRY